MSLPPVPVWMSASSVPSARAPEPHRCSVCRKAANDPKNAFPREHNAHRPLGEFRGRDGEDLVIPQTLPPKPPPT